MLINEQINNQVVQNPIATLPSFSTTDLVQLLRIDSTMGSDRIAGYIKTAYRTVNKQLPMCQPIINQTCVWEHAPTLYSHHHRLSSDPAVTAVFIIDEHWQDTYKDAVLHEAAALMADDYMDFDTIGQGITRGLNDRTKSDSLRRIVSHAIADLTGRRRNRIKLM